MTRDEIKAEIERLKKEHAELDARVESFEAQVWLSPEEQVAQKECKKLKLKTKERIVELTDDLAAMGDPDTADAPAKEETVDSVRAEIESLRAEHAALDTRVQNLEALVWLSPEDEVILRKCKKMKLKLKEQIVKLSDKLVLLENA